MSAQLIRDYTLFFTAVETGDLGIVNSYLNGKDLDPMKNYKMDGKMTTPIRSALKRGDNNMAITLLDSNRVKVSLGDLLITSKDSNSNETLIKRLAYHLDDNNMMLISSQVNNVDDDENMTVDRNLRSFIRQNKLQPSRVNLELTKKVILKKLSSSRIDDDDDGNHYEEEEDEDDDKSSSASSLDSESSEEYDYGSDNDEH